MTATTLKIGTLGELKAAIRSADAVFVRVEWCPHRDPEYVPVRASDLLAHIGADASFEDGGYPDCTPVRAKVSENELYVG